MARDLTRKQVLVIRWSISLAAGAFLILANAASAAIHSGWIALAAFGAAMATIMATAIILLPAWRRTEREDYRR